MRSRHCKEKQSALYSAQCAKGKTAFLVSPLIDVLLNFVQPRFFNNPLKFVHKPRRAIKPRSLRTISRILEYRSFRIEANKENAETYIHK